MSASTTYTALRDDTTTKSLSYNERTFLHSCATGTAPGTSSILRTDGRHPGETRPIRLSFGRAHNMSECTVQFGSSTRVSSSVTCHLIPPPHVDRPNDGSITFAVDLSPMSSMGFDYAQPSSTLMSGSTTSGGGGGGMGQSQSEGQKLLTNRILRILERTLLNGGAIDAEALCVQSGKWVWRLHIDVTVLDHGGNLIDACVLSAVAAMRHFRKPEVKIVSEGSNDDDDKGDDKAISTAAGPSVLHSDEREPTPLPLHHTPLTITFALFSDPTGATTSVSALSDPSHREELVMNGNVTFSFNKYGEMCSLDFAGGCELHPRQLKSCANLGKKKCVELCNMLEDSLAEADKKSIEERLARLKLSTGMNPNNLMPLPDISEGVPFVERTDYIRDGEMMEIDMKNLHDLGSERSNKAAAIAAAEEESYRIQALDYSLGHVAAKVKENDINNKSKRNGNGRNGNIGGGGSLMDAMVKSAEESATVGEGDSMSSSQNAAHHHGIMKYGPVIASSLKEAVAKVSGLPGQPLNNDLQEANDEHKNGSSNKIRSEEADLEMDQLVAEEVAKSDKKSSATNKMLLDSDDEEETQILQNEFSSTLPAKIDDQEPDSKKQKSTKKKEPKKEASSMMDADDDDLDLSAAIKKKSKKKSKKSKK